MIKISLKDGLEIEGHANYEEKGKDIVCAAVSTLFYAYVEEVKAHPQWFKKVDICVSEKSEKKFCKIFLENHCKKVFELSTECIVKMLNRLALEYPEYIQILDV